MAKVTIEWRGDIPYLSVPKPGGRSRKTLGRITRERAEAIRAAYEAELTHGVRILPRSPLVKDFLDKYVDWYDAEHPTTGKRLRSELMHFRNRFDLRNIDQISTGELEQWKASRLTADKAAPETVGKEVRRLKTAFARGMDWGELDSNPMAKVKPPRGVRDVAVEYYDAVALTALYKANTDRAPLWRFMANTGMRRGEIAKATKEDVVKYGQEKRIKVESLNSRVRTKSGRRREIPLNDAALLALDDLPHKLVSVHPDTITEWFTADAAKAKIGGTLHRLRHTFCAHLAIAGVPLRRIQILAGHSDQKTTEIYAHLCPTGALSEVMKISL